MKHIFILNPVAGKVNFVYTMKQLLREKMKDLPYEVYETQSQRDATAYVREYCRVHPDEELRFYACGGDGTIHEVANGIIGFPHASMTVYPCGSGNDFVKHYGGSDVFSDLDNLIFHTEEHRIDLLRINNGVCSINVTSFGFTTAVLRTMFRVRRKKLIGGDNAYYTGVVTALLKNMKNKCVVNVDGEVLNPDGLLLLCTLSNGSYQGGSFYCAPRSDNEDGLIEVCMARPISRLRFIKLVSAYEKGKHLDDPAFSDVVIYRRGKKITLDAPDGFCIDADGEIIEGTHFDLEVIPAAIRFAVPIQQDITQEEGAPTDETSK